MGGGGGGHRLRFGENLPEKKNPASLANKATVSVTPNILQLHI